MEVILLERIEKLGQMGDIVSVKPGYARNYLLPKAKALRATSENSKYFENRRAQLEATNLEKRDEAKKVGKKLNGHVVVLIRQAGESGQLYGSVNARDITNQIIDAGFNINRQQVGLLQPIKSLGIYEVKISLHPEVSVTVTANIARSEEEAKIQSETGHAVLSIEEEEAAKAKIKAEEVFEKAEDAKALEAVESQDENTEVAKVQIKVIESEKSIDQDGINTETKNDSK